MPRLKRAIRRQGALLWYLYQMRYLQKLSTLFIAFITFSIAAYAQQTAPSPTTNSSASDDLTAELASLPNGLTSLASVKPGSKFVSRSGRFSVALPKDGVEIETKFDKDDGETGGEMFTWSYEEGVMAVHYVDMTDFDPKTEEEYAGVAAGAKLGIGDDATVLSERKIMLGKYRGHEIVFENSMGKNTLRVVPVRNRLYTVMFLALADVPDSEAHLLKALDSITLTNAPVRKRGRRK